MDSDDLIAASLLAVAKRHAEKYRMPEGPALEAAVAELRAVATVTQEQTGWSPHPPGEELRTGVLAEVAGILIGGATDAYRARDLIAADLLILAGAEQEVIERWIPIGREWRAAGGAPFSEPPRPGDSVTSPRRWTD